MRNGDIDHQRQARRDEVLYIAACAVVFLVIVVCAAYFVIKLLA
jgi:heme/copper-type cytochrome/quinol oxidase subunit 2